jgi:N12 class adenine-specific DNA methylase
MENTMGKSQTKVSDAQLSLWSPQWAQEDFLGPELSAVAQAVATVTQVTYDLSSMDTIDTLIAQAQDESGFNEDHHALFQQWDAPSEGDDHPRRHWMWMDPLSYQIGSTEAQRMEGNLKALQTVADLQASGQEASNDQRRLLLQYSGWSGLGRIFAPDGRTRSHWSDARDALMALTTPEQRTQVTARIGSAHQTSAPLAQTLWSLVQQLGFTGGRILEPAAGAGHLLAAMPLEIAQRSEITAVEADGLQAGVLNACFAPWGVNVRHAELEQERLPAGFFDLVIGHLPAGPCSKRDTSKAEYAKWPLHSYMLGRSLDLLRMGGLLVCLVPTDTLDGPAGVRRWLAAQAELITSIRLHAPVVDHQAQSSVYVDLLVLKRRMPDYRTQAWVDFDKDQGFNAYYVAHPQQVITWQDPANVLHNLQTLVGQLPTDVYEAAGATPYGASHLRRVQAEGLTRPGSFVLQGGRVCISEGQEWLDIDELYNTTQRKRLTAMIAVKQALLAVMAHQCASQDDDELIRLQGVLNQAYDACMQSWGYLSASANARLMRSDPDWPMLLALEVWDEETQQAAKADIFFRRTVGHPVVPERVDNVKDAVMISLAQFGAIDLKDVARRSGQTVMQVVAAFREQALAYKDPVLNRWLPADEYLSGHIRDKIAAAQTAGAAYALNVLALQAVLPADLGPSEVEVKLGAPWIPAEVVLDFARQLVNETKGWLSVQYEPSTASWTLSHEAGHLRYAGEWSKQGVQWGTQHRCALELLQSALNQQAPTVSKEVDEKWVVDRKATMAAREKWQAIKDHFRSWVFQDPTRRDQLLRLYNDAFNQIVTRKFDGTHLMLPGMSSAVQPYASQKDAIWRILSTGNTLLAHCVGAGKTLVMCAASMELKRLGKAHKPLHVVQNATLEQYTAEFVRLYPQARVLMAGKEDMSAAKRRTFVARVATGDWDAVVMTQATFERIQVSPAGRALEVREQIHELELAKANVRRGGHRPLERRIEQLQEQLLSLEQEGGDSDTVWFEELGVDWIFYDEAHAVKNLERVSKMTRLAGLPSVGSGRAMDLFIKSRVLRAARGHRQEGLVLATATPISSSLAEMHTYQRFLQPQTLLEMGVLPFDAWSASFGETVTGMELSPDGSGYRINTRYCRFVNLPELMGIFRQVADIRTKAMLNLPTPQIATGKVQTWVCHPSATLKAIVADLVQRAEAVRSGAVEPKQDNMLKITSDGRKAALDVRLINPALPADPSGKLAQAAHNIARIWSQSHELSAAQLVFCDMGTPASGGFNVYQALKGDLVALGIPAEQIEFIHDHDSDVARSKLFKRVREGDVRVLVGSTQKMGTGTNVQRRLVAVHQLDAPWVPADVEQRDGRAHRQGNLCQSIELWRYVCEKSFDAYSWNLLSTKANFIEQVMTGQTGLRSVEDISMSALSYAEIKAIASGDPLVLEKATLDVQVQKLSMQRAQWEDERWTLGRRESQLVSRLAWLQKRMPQLQADGAAAAKALSQPLRFVAAPSVSLQTQRAWAQMGVSDALTQVAAAFRTVSAFTAPGAEVVLGQLSGVEVLLSKQLETQIYLIGPNSQEPLLVRRPSLHDLSGMAKSVEAALQEMAASEPRAIAEHSRVSDEVAHTRHLLSQPFEHDQALQQLQQRQREIERELDLDQDMVAQEEPI